MSSPGSPELQSVKTVHPRWQFSLWRLLLWMLGACLTAAFAHWYPLTWPWPAVWGLVFAIWSIVVFMLRDSVDIIAVGILMLLLGWLLAPVNMGVRDQPPRPSRPASLQWKDERHLPLPALRPDWPRRV
jgi:hypothetical protein